MKLPARADRPLLEYVYNVLRTLRTSSIANIVERLRPLLHIDPLTVLPPETTSQIFSYLSPSTLLEASKVSKAWRERTLESRLWKHLFVAEGWGINLDEASSYERAHHTYGGLKKTRSRKAENHSGQREQKRRAREGPASTSEGWEIIPKSVSTTGGTQLLNEQDRLAGAKSTEEDTSTGQIMEEEMSDVVFDSLVPDDGVLDDLSNDVDTMRVAGQSSLTAKSPAALAKKASLILSNHAGSPRLNYHYLYKQKRRLEENWSAGRFTSFQLPHRDHPEEAHTECVYTIQYSGKHLVSGSRDRTLRIWDLDTQRLIRKPLIGHNGSVLCLQFDDSEKEDIIVSGSSDTDVIIWQFSTGKMIKKLSRAHKESVLNLKFDHRFLVTCSKDKTIKIWSRNELRPGDEDYPIKGLQGGGKCPSYIVDLTSYSKSMDFAEQLTDKQMQRLPRFTALMTIESHGAAVNAVHIHKDQLVSASGDRSLMIWNIHSGVRTGVCMGHKKGIACVQYDGKRIVSGSSDDTIRIFDAATHAEVACLHGHSKLVRTIQASFGDLPGSQEDLEREALIVDQAYFEARRSGAIPTSRGGPQHSRREREHRNPGSRRPEDIMAVGAKLPPGGGGSSWGRIVSGSYDETIIIWKKAADGSWVVGHELDQAAALRAAGGPLIARSEMAQQIQTQNGVQQHHAHGPLVLPQGASMPLIPQAGQPSPQTLQQMQIHLSAQRVVQQAMQTGAAALQAGLHNVAALQHQLSNSSSSSTNTHPALNGTQLQAGAAALQVGLQNVAALHHHLNGGTGNQHVHTHPALQPAQMQAFLQLQQQHQTAAHQQHMHGVHQWHVQQTQQTSLQQQQQQQQQQTAPHQQDLNNPHAHPTAANTSNTPGMAASIGQGPAHPMVAAPTVTAPNVVPTGHPNARVFKLQFDARRLICCSQDPKIVGWDFANGDEEIVECSKFFGAPT